MPATPKVVLALCLSLGLSGPALAQATGAPAGRPPATAPGGTEGTAGPGNEGEAIEGGEAVPGAPGAGIAVDGPAPRGPGEAEEAPRPGRR